MNDSQNEYNKSFKELSKYPIGVMMQIILTLYNEKELLTSRLQKKIIASNATYYKARKCLEEVECIKQSEEYTFSKFKPWALTDNGQEVAKFATLMVDTCLTK